jgi:gliding motility-associated-like protein
MSSRQIILFILFLSSGFFAKGQTLQTPCARILSGIGQDSITWTATPCGNFEGYIVYASADTLSPLLPIDTLSNPLQTGYRNANSGELIRYYRIAMLCGGTIVTTSAIVSNSRPITPNLRSVSIVGNSPVLSWYASPSPNVIGYQVYKENPYNSGNFFPYPSNNQIVNGLSFADVGSSSLLVRYAIVALSACNAGLLGEGNALDGTTGPHSSMFLEAKIDSCTRNISLAWNAYENWADDVDFYIVKLSRNGGPAQALDSVTNTSFVYTNAQNGDLLEFWIEAKEKNQSNNAISNRAQISVNVNRPMDYLYLTAVTIDAATQKPQLSWRWDIDTDFGSASIERRSDTTAAWENISVINTIATEANTFIDASADAASLRYFYRISATDACGTTTISNSGATILLQGDVKEGFINQLNWTSLYFDNAVPNEYDIHKLVNSTNTRIATVSDTDSTYNDRVNVNIEAESNSCYYIVAEGIISLPGNPPRYLFSRSNTVCLQQNAILWFPNAIAPDGENREFRPVAGFGSTLQSYSLQVYDRYGAIVFETNDVSTPWTGTKGGQALPQGVYAYIARYTQADGKLGLQKGTVLLLR